MNNEWSKTYCKVRYATYAILVILLAINLRVGWVLFYPYKPLEVKCIKILDEDQIVHPGEKVTYQLEYMKYMDIPATVNRSLVNNIVLNMPSFMSSVPLGHGVVKNNIDIPSFADPGIYKLVFVFDYEVSSFPKRIVRYRAESNTFEVRK